MQERGSTIALSVVLALFGAAAWALHTRADLEVDARPLAALPLAIDRWQGREIPVEETVEQMLRADHNLQRAYDHPIGDRVWLYVGYYGTRRGGRPEHTPWQCYPSAGWDIVSAEQDRASAGPAVNELIVERDGEQRLVHFWYQSHRDSGMLGPVDQALDRLLGRVREGRADGALVRVSTPLSSASPEGIDAARARLRSFSLRLEPLLKDHWPHELPATV